MSIELTPEQRQAILATGGAPLHIHDAETQKVFVLVEQGAEPKLEEEYLRSGVEIAREQIRDGKLGSDDIESVISEARRRHLTAD